MAAQHPHAWIAGDRVAVRGRVWRVIERSSYVDCESLRLRAERAVIPAARTILLPFDRPRRLPGVNGIRVVRPRTSLYRLRAACAEAKPAGGLSSAARTTIALLPYQLEPALAMRRDGVSRVIIADGVGLGKTVQAGLILNELAAEHDTLRALVVVPAGLREQWVRELAARFGLETTLASSAWLAGATSELPADVNPWSLPAIYVVSSDFIKRSEVLRPLEDITWDVVVVDEAHESTAGTARRAAVHAVACRARRVVLLTATPHAGDPEQFTALCRLGAAGTASPPIVMFRRSRAGLGARLPRRSTVLQVRISSDERRMHRLLEQYTSRLCREARARGDLRARLVAIVLRKRALSSAASLAASCARRLRLLEMTDEEETQLLLPLGDEDPLADGEPDAVLGAPGLADVARERRWLAAIAGAAERASAAESKIAFLRRLLGRMNEPAIVFTEYRDTLERLRHALERLRPDLQILHGGMGLRDRAAAQDSFNTRASLLLATDAASEGLNLHTRCRAVIHFELPWNPARLEQRTGRVDRIGQSRMVHELLLVAADTAERLVLAPLLARAERSRAVLPHASRLADALTESRVAAAMMEGERLGPEEASPAPHAFREAPSTLREEAVAEAARLAELRCWQGRHHSADSTIGGVTATALRARRDLPPGIFAVYTVTLAAADGRVAHRELSVAHGALSPQVSCRTPAEVRRVVDRFRRLDEPEVRARLEEHLAARLDRVADRWRQAAAAMAARERTLAHPAPSAAMQLVQAGLFDQRAVRASATRSHAAAARLDESERRIESLAPSSRLERSVQLCAVLVVGASSSR